VHWPWVALLRAIVIESNCDRTPQPQPRASIAEAYRQFGVGRLEGFGKLPFKTLNRSASEGTALIHQPAYEPVWKDWDSALTT